MMIDAEVLAVLSDLDVEGCNVRIDKPLDRPLYVRVDKVLVAIGGKWNRKAKAHVFSSDPMPRLDRVMTTGEVETGQDVGFFVTPDPLARQLVSLASVMFGMKALEPSAGTGSIVRALQDVGAIVTCVERDKDRREALLRDALKARDHVIEIDDFLDLNPRVLDSRNPPKWDRVVMNPPFCKVGKGDHIDHVRHAYAMLKPGGVLVSVLPSSVTFRRDLRYRQFREWLLDSGTITDLPEGSFKSSGTGVNTCVARIVR